MGRHQEFLTPEQIVNTAKFVSLAEPFSIMGPGFGRISFALLILLIVPHNMTRRRILYFIIAAQFIVDIGIVIISLSQCRPIQGWWNHSLKADCWDPRVQQYGGFFQGCKQLGRSGLLRSTTDRFQLSLPLSIWCLHSSRLAYFGTCI